MIQSMLEYSKFILQKVSFDEFLFKKELEKALKILLPEEIKQLINWAKEQFYGSPVYAFLPIQKQ
jgi:hypothetical protein